MNTARAQCLTLLFIVVGAFAAAGLGRKLAANTINPAASLRENGSHITLTGPITCTQVERVVLTAENGPVRVGH